jgi:CHAD domain-containing protein
MAHPSTPLVLSPRDSTATVARRLLSSQLAELTLHLERLQRDSSEQRAVRIHDARVASRRLRVAARLFAALLGGARGTATGAALRAAVLPFEELGQALGAVRTIELLCCWLSSAPTQVRLSDPGHASLLAEAARAGPAAESALTRALLPLVPPRSERLEEAIVRLDGSGRIGGARTRRRLRRRLQLLEQRLELARPLADPRTCHLARLAMKRLRYEAELIDGALPLGELIVELTRLQSLLGDLHDLDERRDWLLGALLTGDGSRWPDVAALLASLQLERATLAGSVRLELGHFLEGAVLAELRTRVG